MKIFKTPNKFIVLFLFTIALVACRKETEEFTEIKDGQEVLEQNSILSDLLLQTALNDGSKDNILDNTSCFSVALPVTIFLNDIRMSINSEEDFSLIEFTFNEFDDDIDSVRFVFPITIITENFEEITIADADQLEAYKQDCKKNLDDKDIECADIKYPIAASVFDADNELIKVITLNTDKALFKFIKKLNTYDRASLVFPITIALYDNSEIVIDNSEALENALKSVIDECDENDLDNEDFIKTLTNTEWSIQKFKEDESNETKDFAAFTFDFEDDGALIAITEEDKIIGSWTISTRVDGDLYLTINFGEESILEKLNKKWVLKSVKDQMVKLENLIDNKVSKDELFFRQKK